MFQFIADMVRAWFSPKTQMIVPKVERKVRHSFNPKFIEEIRFFGNTNPVLIYVNLNSHLQKRVEVPIEPAEAHSKIAELELHLMKPLGFDKNLLVYVNKENITHCYQVEDAGINQYSIVLFSGMAYNLAPDCPLRMKNPLV